ncbi:MAG: sirohydrochlorin cobaltochelatase [Chloroflexota bacterium]|nr:MAG: sirohydrochlorin cobaltochelatase [Chloroflexota bacterium]
MKRALLLLGHGSRAREANEAMYAIMDILRRTAGFEIVEAGFMELNPPTIADGMAVCVEQGAQTIIVIPYFLHMGRHVQKDLPETVQALREKYPQVTIRMGRHIGFHPKLAEIVRERIEEAESVGIAGGSGDGHHAQV